MTNWQSLTLPNGEVVQTSSWKRDEFWRRSGVSKGTDLQTVKKGHADRIHKLAAELFPDQIKGDRHDDH